MRVEEPFIKAHLALWLVSEGAQTVTISIDGAEPNPRAIQKIFANAGYSHRGDAKSKVAWTGLYQRDDVTISVASKPGADVMAVFRDKQTFSAECKGEPTPSAERAGRARVAFCAGIGQLLMIAGRNNQGPNVLALVVPDTKRFVELAGEVVSNQLLCELGLHVLLVSEHGRVRQVPKEPKNAQGNTPET